MGNSDEILISKFVWLGLTEQKAKESLKNASLTKNLSLAISSLENQNQKIDSLTKGSGMLIYHLCSKIKAQSLQHIDILVSLIAENKLDTTVRVDFALEYVLNHSVRNTSIDVAQLEMYCGVNVCT